MKTLTPIKLRDFLNNPESSGQGQICLPDDAHNEEVKSTVESTKKLLSEEEQERAESEASPDCRVESGDEEEERKVPPQFIVVNSK